MPFLVSVKSNKVIIDPREHSEMVWVNPKDIVKFDLVKGVKEDLQAVGILRD